MKKYVSPELQVINIKQNEIICCSQCPQFLEGDVCPSDDSCLYDI